MFSPRKQLLLCALACRSLLARLVLAREEVQQLLLQHEFTGGGGTHEPGPDSDDARPGDTAARTLLGMRQPFTQLDAVPTSCAAFLQRLVAMPGPRERCEAAAAVAGCMYMLVDSL